MNDVPVVRKRSKSIRGVAWIGVTIIAALLVGILWYSDHNTLTNQINSLTFQLGNSQSQLATTTAQLTAVEAEALHPRLLIDNTTQVIKANRDYLESGVPDTFTYHLVFSSDVEVTYAFLNVADYVRFASCDTSRIVMKDPSRSKLGACLFELGGVYAQPWDGSDSSLWGGGTSISRNFHDAEGCAGWVLIQFPANANQRATITQHISVTYNPAPSATPPCTE